MEQTQARDADREASEILERVAEGVVVLDAQLRPLLANHSAASMLGFKAASLPPRVPSEEVLSVARRALAEDGDVEDVISTWFPLRRSLRVKASRLDPDRIVVVLQDVTDEVMSQRVRREFVSHASHELKSPVAGLQALAEALSGAVHDDPEAALRFADRIVAEAERLGRLVSDLLDLSRLEDPARLPEDPVDIADVARREIDEIRPTIEAKSMRLETRLEGDLWVRGDEQQLGVMIRNLLDNAVRYTSEGGRIEISGSARDGTVAISVADDGIGIPPDARARVFERFYRVDRARSRDRGGTGLGLAIVKHVAEIHGGRVEVESSVGRGSTFTALFPSPARPAAPGSVAS